VVRCKPYLGVRLEDACLDSSDWDRADATDLLNILKWDAERLVSRSLWYFACVKDVL